MRAARGRGGTGRRTGGAVSRQAASPRTNCPGGERAKHGFAQRTARTPSNRLEGAWPAMAREPASARREIGETPRHGKDRRARTRWRDEGRAQGRMTRTITPKPARVTGPAASARFRRTTGLVPNIGRRCRSGSAIGLRALTGRGRRSTSSPRGNTSRRHRRSTTGWSSKTFADRVPAPRPMRPTTTGPCHRKP